MSFFKELKRRNVIRVAIAYAIVGWLLVEVASVVLPTLLLPDWTLRILVLFVILGFPLALIFAWAYELTPEGLKKEKDVDRSESITHITGRKLDYLIIAVLVFALGYFAFDKFVLDPSRDAELVQTTTEAVTEQAAETADKSIAVLAFADLSPEGDQEYFSDGISEELLNLLAQLPGLRVAARTSSFQFKGQHEDIAKIADALNVSHILEGSVRKSGNKLRITAQLIKADDGFHLWSSSYDRELDDIFAVQDEIAGAIIDVLKVKLALVAGEAVQPTVIKAANSDAYDAYLQGRELIRLRYQENLEDAVRHLERSLRLDNNFAPAHAQLAIAITLSASTLEEKKQKAIGYLDRAQELEPDLAEAHGGRALLANFSADYESTVEHARRALALNPSYSDAMNWLYIALARLGRYEEADATLKQMLVTDPLTMVGRFNYSILLNRKGRVKEAHELADQLLEESQAFKYWAHTHTSLIWEGKIAEGLSWALRALAEDPSDYWGSEHPVLGFIWIGEYDEARRINNILNYMVDVAEERFDEAIRATHTRMRSDSENSDVLGVAANVLYLAGRIDEALPLYERLRDFVPEGRPILPSNEMYSSATEMTMRLALARRKADDEDGAQAAVQIAKQDHAARHAAGRKDQFQYRAEAMIAAFENNPDRVIAALKSAMRLGLRDPQVFSDPIFEDLWDEPRFVELQQELDAILAAEHEKVLQLICFNNPVPDNWQPLPETCEGVEEQVVL